MGLDLVVRGSQIEPDIGRPMALVAAYGGFVAGTQTQSASAGSPAHGTVELQVAEVRGAGPLLFALLLLGALWIAGRSLWRLRRRRGVPS
jgi:hypothetical protein